MTDRTTARVTPEMQAELRRLLDEAKRRLSNPRRAGKTYAMEALRNAAGDALPALLDAAAERDRLAAAVERARVLATEWATQPTDYDEDTEQQIEDGNAILRALDTIDSLAPLVFDLLAEGWDTAVRSMCYKDGTPVEIVVNGNPYRRPTA